MEINNTLKILEEKLNLKLNLNQTQEIKRLIYEIGIRENIVYEEIINEAIKKVLSKNTKAKDRFVYLKQILINQRYPLSTKTIDIKSSDIFFSKIPQSIDLSSKAKKEFIPEKIFIEKPIINTPLSIKVQKEFSPKKIVFVEETKQIIKELNTSTKNIKTPYLFITKENWDFIKPCPCTKGHLGCGYWILNLGFGCPFDCSYCYLQQYQNFPGIILPANLEQFLGKTESFIKKLKGKIRIGTGEFSDSLALDKISGYSKALINFFADKNILFELKTKSIEINNILELKGKENIIISWSLNPQKIIQNEEINTCPLDERLKAAKQIKTQGFSLAFHFDPIIYSQDWENLYKEVIDKLYAQIPAPFAWISLGTLRFNRQLKTVIEHRFPKSRMIYEELFLGEDKKMRYPEFLRIKIYKSMLKWIRRYDKKTPIYLCMENKYVWQKSIEGFKNTKDIETYLTKDGL